MLLNVFLSNIKISTLCNSAEINRATFYSHYKDVNDLFEEIIDEFMANICNYIAKLYSLENQDRKEEFMNFVKYVDNNSDIFLLIFENSTNIEFTSTQYLELHQKIHCKISTSYNQNTYATYITNFFIYCFN